MTRIDNTTKRMQDPAEKLLFLAEGLAYGSDGAIENQERDGQRQLVNSDQLPTRAEAQVVYEALGFTFGEPDASDPMFRPATLPPGWSRKGSDHAMWSYLVDELGRERAGIFYRAAFYDRSAHMSLTSLDSYVRNSVEYDAGPVIFDDQWATREAVAAALAEIRDAKLGEAADFRGYAADESGRDAKNRERCAEIAVEREAKAAMYEAAMAALPGS
jgi:hypothetical protein